MWLYHRGQVFKADATETVSGKVALEGLKPGAYQAVWWDTVTGKAIRTVPVKVTGSKIPVLLETPPILHDVALYVEGITK